MAVANTKSTLVTNADADPPVPNQSWQERGGVKVFLATVEVAAADDDNSVYRFARVKSGDTILKIELFNDAITGGTAYHIGIHLTAKDGGAVEDADLFASSVDCSSARVAPLDATHEALAIEDGVKRLWDMNGDTADGFQEFDITMTGATVGTAAGTLTLKIWIAE